MTVGKVYIIGAGPGAPDLITIRGREVLERADVIIYADSLVDPRLCAYARPGAEIYGSAQLTLEEIMALILSAAQSGKTVARVHSGDPAIYGAIHEQVAILEQAGIPYEIIPGVSSAFAAAARLGVELTVPDVSQTVIFTRQPGRTAVPERERLRDLARHQATLVLFLSVAHIAAVVTELREGGYPEDTPVAVIYRATWPDELVLQGTLADIAQKVKQAKLQVHAIILVGRALDPALRRGEGYRSNLYRAEFSHRYRQGKKERSE